MDKVLNSYFKLFLLAGMLCCSGLLSAGIPTPKPKEKPISTLQRFNATRDTTGLSICLAYLNENLDKKRSQEIITELLKATQTAEKMNIIHISGFYSLLKKHYDLFDNKSKSFEYALKIYKLLSKTRREKDLLWILVDIGNIFYEENDYAQATVFYKRAERVARKQNDKYPLSVIYMNYGLIEAQKGNHLKALNHYKVSAKYRIEAENVKAASVTYIKIANTYLELNKPDSCLYYIRLAEDHYFNKGEQTHFLADVPNSIDFSYAEYYAYLGNFKKAHHHIQKAQDYCIKNDILDEYIVDVETEFNYFVTEQKYNEAIQCISSVLPILKWHRMLKEQKMVYGKLGKFYNTIGAYEKADAAMKQYIQLDDSLDLHALKSQLTMIRSISAAYESDEILQQTKKNLALAKLNNRLSEKETNTSIIITVISIVIIVILLALFRNLRSNRKTLISLRDKFISQNQEISENSAELEATNQLKDKLFSIIAHDLRNPLNRMLVELAIVKKSIPEANLTMHMENTLKETIELFEGLLQWSKLDNNQNVYSPLKINLNDHINKVIAQYTAEINTRGITLTRNTEVLLIFADQNIIQTLLRNLVSNGILFASKNDKNKTFHIETYEIEGNKIEMVVSNSGPKFTDEALAEFYNLDEHMISNHMSLGLSICKLLTKMCGWKMDIENYSDSDGIFVKIQIPKFVSRKPTTLDPGFHLPPQYIQKLAGLQDFKFYQTSQIRAYLKSMGEVPEGNVKIWMENMEEAVHEGDEKTYVKLIQILDQNRIPVDLS